MKNIIKAQRGTADILPNQSYKWRYVERIFAEVATVFGFKEIRTPVFEATELFARGVGDGTDIVQKEMYTFDDKGGRSVTLRPEGTAGVVRAVIENSLLSQSMPLKVFYIITAYRYEKPQKGRGREFHQLGAEIFGADFPAADIRLIDFMISFFAELGLKNLNLEINSIGCHDCRGEYYKALAGYMRENSDELCPTCIVRLEKNPMRILDCKNPACIQISEKAPMIIGYLCGECESHFNEVKSGLDILKIKYSVNPKIVRGLDYYTRTVFEFVTDEIGAQGTVCGGGRYDDLIENLGGAAVSGLGFALGVERLMILMEKLDTLFEPEEPCMLYICNAGEKSRQKTLEIASALNRIGKRCECDETGRGLKAQMKFADKLGAKYTAVIGDEELETDTAKVKNMQTGETIAMSLNDIKKGKMK